MDETFYVLFAVLGLLILVFVLSKSLKIIKKVVINSLIGFVILVAINYIGHYYNFFLGVNVWTVFITGFFGIPGVVFLFLLKNMM